MTRTWKRAVASLIVVAAGVLVVPTSAQAATSNCPAGYTCIWKDHDYKTAGSDGTLTRLYYYIPDLGLWQYKASDGTGGNSGYSSDNSASSVYNHGNSESARYYKDKRATGSYFTLTPGSVRNNLATSLSPIGFNDTISSIYFTSSDPNI